MSDKNQPWWMFPETKDEVRRNLVERQVSVDTMVKQVLERSNRIISARGEEPSTDDLLLGIVANETQKAWQKMFFEPAPRAHLSEPAFWSTPARSFGFEYPTYPTYGGISRQSGEASNASEAEAIAKERTAAIAMLELSPNEERVLREPPSKGQIQSFELTEEGVQSEFTQLAIEAEMLCGYSVLREKLKIDCPLKRALIKLEIQPLNPAHVSRYQQDKILEMRAKTKLELKQRTTQVTRQYQVANAIDFRWRNVSVGGYGEEIPIFAISKMVSIKKECPMAEFNVSYLAYDPFLSVELGDAEYFIEVWDEPGFEAKL